MCIISTAQHAKPKVMGHKEPLRTQLMSWSTLVVTYSSEFFGANGFNVLDGPGRLEGCSVGGVLDWLKFLKAIDFSIPGNL